MICLRAHQWLRMLLYTFLLPPLLTIGALSANTVTHASAPMNSYAVNANDFRIVVQSSSHAIYQSEILFSDKKMMRELKQAGEETPFKEPLPPDATLFYKYKGVEQSFGVTTDGKIVNLSKMTIVHTPSYTQERLTVHVQALRAKHYGEVLPWGQAAQILPRFSKFTIVDVETGLSFEGQRRAGSNHADVQPVTRQDSATLKNIYGGAWSWDRRAVLVKLNDRTLAASMHGMPHGGDGIPGNDFNGHFCVHFLGSATHRSHTVDPAHQIMVHRAAGLLTTYVSKLSPWALIDVWITGVNQGDQQLLQVATGQELTVPMSTMRRLSTFPEQDVSQLLKLDAAIDVSATPEGSNAIQKRRVLFHLERVAPEERWYIRSAVIQ